MTRTFYKNLLRVLQLHEWNYTDDGAMMCATCGSKHREKSKSRSHKQHCEFAGILELAKKLSEAESPEQDKLAAWRAETEIRFLGYLIATPKAGAHTTARRFIDEAKG